MSNRDFLQYGSALKLFEGKPFTATLATNSIKLMFNQESHLDQYIWIDPPWTVENAGGETVAGGGGCPDHTEPNYEQKFRTWCTRVAAMLKGARLESVACSAEGKVELRLSSGHCLVLQPAGGERGADDWYDDWYAKLDDA